MQKLSCLGTNGILVLLRELFRKHRNPNTASRQKIKLRKGCDIPA